MKRTILNLVDESEGFAGWVNGETWNGWECPFFELESAIAIVAMLNRWFPDCARMEGNIAVVELEGERDEFAPQSIETPDGIKTVYAIGKGAWCWTID